MIKRIKASNIRLFGEIDINFSIKNSKRNGNLTLNDDYFEVKKDKILKNINILGTNSSGKTSILEIILIYTNWSNPFIIYQKAYQNVINEIAKNDFQSKFNLENIITNKNDDKSKLGYENILNEIKYEDILEQFKAEWEKLFLLNSNDKNNSIKYEIEFINLQKELIVHSIEIKKEGIIKSNLYRKKENKKEENIDTWEINFFNNLNYFNDLKNFNKYIEYTETIILAHSSIFSINPLSIDMMLNPIKNNGTRKHVNEKFFQIFKHSKENKQKFLDWIKIADDSINDVILDNDFKILGDYEKTSGTKIPLDKLSSGTIKWIYFYYMLYVDKFSYDGRFEKYDKVLLIDEIENYLHLKLVHAFLKISKNSKENCQIIYTTHNQLIINSSTRHESIFVIDYDENKKHKLFPISNLKIKKDKNILRLFLNESISSHPDGDLIEEWIKKYEN